MFNKIMNIKKIHQDQNIKIYIYQKVKLIYNKKNNKFKVLIKV